MNRQTDICRWHDFTLIKIIIPSIDIENTTKMAEELKEFFEEVSTERNLIIDMAEVGYISSSAIGLFVTIHTQLYKSKHNLYFINLKEPVEKVFEITKLKTFFNIYNSCDELVECLKK